MAVTDTVSTSASKLADAVRVSALVPAALIVWGSFGMTRVARNHNFQAAIAGLGSDATVLIVLLSIAVVAVAAGFQQVQSAVFVAAIGHPLPEARRPSDSLEPFEPPGRVLSSFCLSRQHRRWARLTGRLGTNRVTPWPLRFRLIQRTGSVSMPRRDRIGELLSREFLPVIEHPDIAPLDTTVGRFDLRPTRLGNRLARADFDAGYRNGFSVPHLGPLLMDAVPSPAVATATSVIESCVGLSCACVMLAAMAAVLQIWVGQWFLLLAIAWLAVACGAWRLALTATVPYAEALDRHIELHRFDLLTALHLPLPKTRVDEIRLFRSLAVYYSGEYVAGLQADGGSPRADDHLVPAYRHPEPSRATSPRATARSSAGPS